MRPTPPRLEALEARENPAGNVTGVMSGNQLVLSGDASDNWFGLQQDWLGNTIVYGLNNTLINGQTALYLGRWRLSDVYINTWGGNDAVHMAGVGASSCLYTSLRDGSDALQMVNSGGTYLAVDGQDGNDTIAPIGVVGFYAVDVTGGTGFDVLQDRGIFAGVVRLVPDFELWV
jgi:hypothetical protein